MPTPSTNYSLAKRMHLCCTRNTQLTKPLSLTHHTIHTASVSHNVSNITQRHNTQSHTVTHRHTVSHNITQPLSTQTPLYSGTKKAESEPTVMPVLASRMSFMRIAEMASLAAFFSLAFIHERRSSAS